MCASRGLPSAASLRKFLPAVGYALLPAAGPLCFSLGPAVPSLALLSLSCLHSTVRGTVAATPRAPLKYVRSCFRRLPGHFIHPLRHSEPWRFTLIILHVVLGYFHHTFCALPPSRSSRVLSPHACAVSTARLVLSPCSFTLLVVRGARPCFQGFPVTARSSSNGFHVLRVVWWSPTPPLFSLPRAA